MYIDSGIRWVINLQNFRSADVTRLDLIRIHWACVWAWIAFGVVYCAIISVLVCYQLWPVWSHMHTSNLPDPDDTRASTSISQRWSRSWAKHRGSGAVVSPPLPPPLSHHHHRASGKVDDKTLSTATEGATTTVVTPPSHSTYKQFGCWKPWNNDLYYWTSVVVKSDLPSSVS